jgi:hypothetical protein
MADESTVSAMWKRWRRLIDRCYYAMQWQDRRRAARLQREADAVLYTIRCLEGTA